MTIKDQGVCNSAALRKAQRRISQLYDSVLAPTGLRSSQRSMLLNIERGDHPTLSALAQALVLDLSALTRNLKPLERDGYVKLVADEKDGRARRISLTKLGRQKLAEADQFWEIAQGSFESAYGKANSAQLRKFLADVLSETFANKFNSAVAVRSARLVDSEN